ncbi:MAG: caspase family protein [Nitrospinota bacterium]|nr:caspase family protein [Nitrospinota bacterium]
MRLVFGLALVGFLLGSSTSSLAAEAPRNIFYAKSWAVVIGVNNYKNWPRLESAVNDANTIEAELTKHGFTVIKLLDGQATRGGIAKTLGYTLQQEAGPNDRIVVFYAGHGHTEEGVDGGHLGYIVPVDADLKDLSTYISMDELRLWSRRIQAKHLMYVMDSCYSGLGLSRSGAMAPNVRNYVRKITSRTARQMITAGQQGEQVAEVGGHGLFTRLFVQGLRGSADQDDNGVITATELAEYLKPKVSIESNNLQTPQFGRLPGDDSGEFVFLRPGADPSTLMKDSLSGGLGPSESLAMAALGAMPEGMSPAVREKIMAVLTQGAPRAKRIMKECPTSDSCIGEARKMGVDKVAMIMMSKEVNKSALGAYIGVLTLKVAMYDVKSAMPVGKPAEMFFQMPAWDPASLDWGMAAEKIMASAEFAQAGASIGSGSAE